MSFVLYARNVRDADHTVTKALPAAAANHNTDTIDLGQAKVQNLEEIEFEIAIPALAALVDAKTVTVKLQDSDDDSTYADTDPLIRTTVVGAGGAGSAAKTVRFRVPSTVRRYLQLNIAVESGGGTLTASSIVFSALF